MSKLGNLRISTCAAVLVALTLGVGAVWADEPPPEDFPPPVDTPKPPPPPEAPKTEAPKTEAPKPEMPKPEMPKAEKGEPAKKPATGRPGSWSPPAVTPGGSSALPPPQIVRRRSGSSAPTAPSAPLPPSTGSGPVAPVAPPIVDVPTTRPPVPPPPAVTPPAVTPPVVQPPALPPPSMNTPKAPPAFPTAATASRVFGVSKTHNVPLTGGDLALQLDVDYEVQGQNGRNVYVAIWFVRTDTGSHIRSAVTTYADSDGFVTLQTRSAAVRGSPARFTATLKIPYRAFPVAQSSESYEVEARVQILRAEGQGRATSLARGTTTFRVYGYSEDEKPADAR